MIENRDGSFGEIGPAGEILKSLVDSIPETVKSVHFGTVEELQARAKRLGDEQDKPDRDNPSLQQQINELTKNVNRIMIRLGLDDKSEILVI